MVVISGIAQVFDFRKVNAKPDNFKMTFSKFEIFSAELNQELGGFA